MQAANLVQDAERAIAKANPPRQGERTDKNNFALPEGEVIPQKTIRNIRQAHDNITDEEFEAARLTRRYTHPNTPIPSFFAT